MSGDKCGSEAVIMPMNWTLVCALEAGHDGHHWDDASGLVWPRPLVSLDGGDA